MRNVSSWGRLDAHSHDVVDLNERATVAAALAGHRPGIARGMGRSYGDVCLNPGGVLWNATQLDRYLRFDETSGHLVCEAGVQLGEIQKLTIPRGWILPVTPGTQFVTVGGAIANDIHGKNHHSRGSFGDHVASLTLVRTDGEMITCGPSSQPEWFAATVGGLGLTGVIVSAELRLVRVPGPWMETEIVPYATCDEALRLSTESEAAWEYTVAWIDCTRRHAGRGIFTRGNFVPTTQRLPPKKRAAVIPFTPPISLVNGLSVKAISAAHFRSLKHRAGREVAHYEPVLYPLDNISGWNRLYGPRGFFQYQCVVPPQERDAIKAMLNEIARSDQASFLTVLKTFGDRKSVGLMSFPRPGITLAVDFPNTGAGALQLFERLNAIVRAASGRIYPAKDACMPRDLFESGYPQLDTFLKYRDPGISSAFSRRLMGR